MKKSIQIKCTFSSSSRNTHIFEYYIDDKQVDELLYYGLEHLKDAQKPELVIALREIRGQEPADMTLYMDWNAKCFLIEDLLNKLGFSNKNF